ncbi:CpaF family protein [Cellulomonas chitinilytica]|uniref:CpaF family protein n=1 Tax=Cellulomonas chitinilytica TaxID=398759 RepID=UPI001943587B|nr:CpaF/VirB11 family protein [Cellulomonas chitinilytica]
MTATSPTAGRESGIDWGLVTAFRTQVATELTKTQEWSGEDGEGGGGGVDRPTRERLGRRIIDDLLRAHRGSELAAGAGEAWSREREAAIGQAVFDAAFRLGRLQPLVDRDDVENIFILGRRVLLQLVDGSRVEGPAVADTAEELIDFLKFVANRSESNPRPFSEGTPKLHMKLDGGARLAATAWVVSEPTVVIRRHRFALDSLSAWVERDGLSPSAANFLGAMVAAGWSAVVAGPQSAGKTTLTRAMCAHVPEWEVIGTFETEYELFLKAAGRHDVVVEWEARPGIGELGASGRAAGAYGLDEALDDSFRFALDRQIVGEVRGREVWTMIKAMESGTGSLSTTHAASAEACIRKLVTCAMEAGPHVTRDLALEKLVGALQVVVQLRRRVLTLPDGSRELRRWVSEIVLVEPGERETGFALTHLYGPSGSGPARATGMLPNRCHELVDFGLDIDLFQREARAAGWSS